MERILQSSIIPFEGFSEDTFNETAVLED